jgi:hypothetical protein
MEPIGLCGLSADPATTLINPGNGSVTVYHTMGLKVVCWAIWRTRTLFASRAKELNILLR